MVHYQALIVKVAAIIGATHIVGSAVAEADASRQADGGLWAPLVGSIRGVGNAFIGTVNNIGAIIKRVVPPRDPKIDLPHIVEGLAVLATGPAFLGLLFSTIYLDAKRKGELNLDLEYHD